MEPNEWLVEEGIKRELGETLLQIKRRPSFFRFTGHDCSSQQLVRHRVGSINLQPLRAGPDKELAVRHFAFTCAEWRFDCQFLIGEEDSRKMGWIYPECVNYRPATLEHAAADVNLRFQILDWKHPRQTWALFAAPEFDSGWFKNKPLTWNAALERALRQKHQSMNFP